MPGCRWFARVILAIHRSSWRGLPQTRDQHRGKVLELTLARRYGGLRERRLRRPLGAITSGILESGMNANVNDAALSAARWRFRTGWRMNTIIDRLTIACAIKHHP